MRNRLILCVGFRGSGKSTVASEIIKLDDRIFVFDPHGDEVHRWIPNVAHGPEKFEDYLRWVAEAE